MSEEGNEKNHGVLQCGRRKRTSPEDKDLEMVLGMRRIGAHPMAPQIARGSP
jgi:hypothetical protein